ncbi:hypothetical protein B0H10DRAFT_172325 [Mycena sp. CBHHK59/15]|nr:hypothetical protein B0H10DRAFT_172325 [Mycena sp. CBHHK59/15]
MPRALEPAPRIRFPCPSSTTTETNLGATAAAQVSPSPTLLVYLPAVHVWGGQLDGHHAPLAVDLQSPAAAKLFLRLTRWPATIHQRPWTHVLLVGGQRKQLLLPAPKLQLRRRCGCARIVLLRGRVRRHMGRQNNGSVERRASSAQAFFSPSSFADYSSSGTQPQEHAEEELPDADTSLFEAGFLNSFDASASPASDAVSPFGAAQQVVHAPQPVHAGSPLGVEFTEHAQQTAQAYQ